MCFMYNKLAESFPPSFPASFVRKELGKPVFLLLFSEVGSVKVQLQKDPNFRNEQGLFALEGAGQLNQDWSV